MFVVDVWYSTCYVLTQQLLFNVVELTSSYCLLHALLVINDRHLKPRTEIKTPDTNLISQVTACLCNPFHVKSDSSKRSFISLVYLCPWFTVMMIYRAPVIASVYLSWKCNAELGKNDLVGERDIKSLVWLKGILTLWIKEIQTIG